VWVELLLDLAERITLLHLVARGAMPEIPLVG
jgi:hypothetical protein